MSLPLLLMLTDVEEAHIQDDTRVQLSLCLRAPFDKRIESLFSPENKAKNALKMYKPLKK